MSFKAYDFRCSNGHEFEDLAKSVDESVPCPTCASPAKQFWKPGRGVTIRPDSGVTDAEKLQAFAQCGPRVKSVEDLPRALAEFSDQVSTRSGLKKLLKKNGFDMAVNAREMNEEIMRIAALEEKAPETVEEMNAGLSDEEIDRRRAITMESLKRAKEMAAAGTLPPKTIPTDAPDEVKEAAAAVN